MSLALYTAGTREGGETVRGTVLQGCALAALLTLVTCAGLVRPQGAEASVGGARRGIVEIRTVRVGDPGNAPVGIVPFQGPPEPGIYQNCVGVPGCVLVGGVGYAYRLGELEITVGQYVDFLTPT